MLTPYSHLMNFGSRVKFTTFLSSALFVATISYSTAASAASPWGSISFDGTQYLSSTNMSAPRTGDFTYELWFYNTVETSTNQFIKIHEAISLVASSKMALIL